MSSAYYYLYYQKDLLVLIRLLAYYNMLMALATSCKVDTNTRHLHVEVRYQYVAFPCDGL